MKGFVKGTPKPKNSGRKQGVKNKVTIDKQRRVNHVLELLDENIPTDLQAMKPRERAALYGGLLEFTQPKLSRVEFDIEAAKTLGAEEFINDFFDEKETNTKANLTPEEIILHSHLENKIWGGEYLEGRSIPKEIFELLFKVWDIHFDGKGVFRYAKGVQDIDIEKDVLRDETTGEPMTPEQAAKVVAEAKAAMKPEDGGYRFKQATIPARYVRLILTWLEMPMPKFEKLSREELKAFQQIQPERDIKIKLKHPFTGEPLTPEQLTVWRDAAIEYAAQHPKKPEACQDENGEK
jgi:hypothetical protein